MSAGSTMGPCAAVKWAMPTKDARNTSASRTERVFIGVKSPASECRRRVNPQQRSLRAARILPAMGNRAFKIEAVPHLQPIMFAIVQPDFKFPAKNVEELLPFVGVGFAAPAAGFNA